MKQIQKNSLKKLGLSFCLCVFGITSGIAQGWPGQRPAYLHALTDLRAARWMIQHRPGNWAQSNLELDAVKQIDAAINDIKQAAINDGKNIDDHPQVDERNDHNGRLHAAHDYLKKAHDDISKGEDNQYSRDLRNRSYKHIGQALQDVDAAIHAN